jgi:hypothetical protein
MRRQEDPMLNRALIVVTAVAALAGCARSSPRSQPAPTPAGPSATPRSCDCTRSHGSPTSTEGVQRWG